MNEIDHPPIDHPPIDLPIDLRRFDLNLLVVFEVLMAELSVTRAAERLGRTQSAVSHSLARLRAERGDPLLIKGGARLQPTAFAVELPAHAAPIRRFASGGVQRGRAGRTWRCGSATAWRAR